MGMNLGIEDMSTTEEQQEELQKYGLLEDEEQLATEEQPEVSQESERQEIQNYLDSQNQEVVDEYTKVQATDYAGKLEEINEKLDSINVHNPSVRDEVKTQLLQLREELTQNEELTQEEVEEEYKKIA